MTLSRSLMPSLQELTAFEAVGRHKNFTIAAEELSLTQSAISKQIKNLENTLGILLFHRHKGKIELTTQGERYLHSVRKILFQYETETHSIIASAGSESTLRIASIPSLASRWLIPVLPEFLANHPTLTIEITSEIKPFDFSESPVDVAIHYGAPSWPYGDLIYMCHDTIVAVANAHYLKSKNIKRGSDLHNATLLQQSTRPHMWQEWAENIGISLENPYRGPIFDQFTMTIHAAIAGLGIALVPTFLIREELRNGQLIALDEPLQFGRGAYYLVLPHRKKNNPINKAFVDWVISLTRQFSRQPDLAKSNTPDARTFINPYESP